MFLKLLKHDFKYYSKKYMAIIMGIVCFAILNLLQDSFFGKDSFLAGDFFTMVGMMAVAIILMYAVILGIKIFNQKFISEESYLMFSLPVTKNQQLLSNLIVCFIWCTLVSIFYYAFMSTFLSVYYNDPVSFLKGIKDYCNRIGLDVLLLIVESVMLLNIIYFCIAFVNSANMKRFSKLIGMCLFALILYAYINLKTLISNLCNHDDYMRNIYFLAVALFANVIFYFSTLYILEKKIEVD